MAKSNGSTRSKSSSRRNAISWVYLLLSFLFGCVLSTMLVLNSQLHHPTGATAGMMVQLPLSRETQQLGNVNKTSTTTSVLHGVRILVAIAAYDFSQLPHLEEVLDGYHDLCFSGSAVKVVIYATVAYPIPLLDMLNSRLQCPGFQVQIILKYPGVRLHLVDFHRELFYQEIDSYDLFIYTEDDILVTPTTVGAYLLETLRVQQMVGLEESANFNVGVVRYEYNYPPDIIINDKTRHATQNVTRVYWEHAWKPAIPKCVDSVPQPALSKTHVHMTNHHQGMFLATRFLLLKWKDRPNCQFNVIRNRPGLKNRPSQPAEGTQRVWMSSQMLYGGRHCNVQQVIPMDTFGQLTVWHLPNKNYRRVGKKGRLGGANAAEPRDEEKITEFDLPSDMLLSELELHIMMRKTWPAQPKFPYRGIEMVDQAGQRPRSVMDSRLADYKAYVERGGVMSDEDMKKTAL